MGTRRDRATGARFARMGMGLSIALAMLFVVAGPLSASAQYLLGEAKAAGQVGEKLTGYVGLVDPGAPADIVKMVEDTNERRKQRYGNVAKKRGTTVESVGKQAAKKLIVRAKPGAWVETAEGKWAKKE